MEGCGGRRAAVYAASPPPGQLQHCCPFRASFYAHSDGPNHSHPRTRARGAHTSHFMHEQCVHLSLENLIGIFDP
jgi:hypothetical protein